LRTFAFIALNLTIARFASVFSLKGNYDKAAYKNDVAASSGAFSALSSSLSTTNPPPPPPPPVS
jgi:hypothetical protein